MIEFDCPECGEVMAIRNHMIGKRIRCVECDALVRVPEESIEPGAAQRRKYQNDPGLSSKEYWLYALLFLFVPYACVFVSSILYYVWKGDKPKRADQINKLGFIIVGINILIGAAVWIVLKGI